MDDECIHGIEAAWCSMCKGTARITPETGPPIVARFDGHCVGCNLPTHAGELICRSGDTWIHSECA